jgi:hypothetical protein
LDLARELGDGWVVERKFFVISWLIEARQRDLTSPRYIRRTADEIREALDMRRPLFHDGTDFLDWYGDASGAVLAQGS